MGRRLWVRPETSPTWVHKSLRRSSFPPKRNYLKPFFSSESVTYFLLKVFGLSVLEGRGFSDPFNSKILVQTSFRLRAECRRLIFPFRYLRVTFHITLLPTFELFSLFSHFIHSPSYPVSQLLLCI